jgi:transcriptional regulator with XRE-family HTH domain
VLSQENNFGEMLSGLRKGSELSQELLAEKLNVTRQTVSSWERNKSVPDISTLGRICLVFGVTMDDLVRSSNRKFVTNLKNQAPVNGGVSMSVESGYQPNKYDQAIGLGYAVSLFIAPILFSLVYLFNKNHFHSPTSILLLAGSCLFAFLALGLTIHMGITLKRK